jgi:SRSO17 transposase
LGCSVQSNATPYSLQHLLDRAPWNADAVRDDLTEYIVEELGDPNGVLVIDETGFLKKGSHSVSVQRQYSGTAGRIENCQIGVFMAYAGRHGRALMDRELYLPREWIDDLQRRKATKIPEHIEFKTKPQLAQQMIERTIAANVPFAWIAGDEVYGDNLSLRVWLEQQDLPSCWLYVATSMSRLRKCASKQWSNWAMLSPKPIGKRCRGERHQGAEMVRLGTRAIASWSMLMSIKGSLSS